MSIRISFPNFGPDVFYKIYRSNNSQIPVGDEIPPYAQTLPGADYWDDPSFTEGVTYYYRYAICRAIDGLIVRASDVISIKAHVPTVWYYTWGSGQPSSRDQVVIDLITQAGMGVEIRSGNELETDFEYKVGDRLFIPSSGDGNYTEHPTPDPIISAEMPVITSSRWVSRILFEMANDSTRTANLSSFNIVDLSHPIAKRLEFPSGPIYTSSRRAESLSDLSDDTTQLFSRVWEKKHPHGNRIHFGYYQFDSLSDVGKRLLLELIKG